MQVTHNFHGETHDVPDDVQDRTAALLSQHPPTNQQILLDTAQWWFEHVGNCPIYRWAIYRLTDLEIELSWDSPSEKHKSNTDIYRAARQQAQDIGFDV